eukprot:Clim_evm46s236 gene=Clim_evmTU46s236
MILAESSSIDRDSPVCRVCWVEATADNGLVSPCKCTGSLQFIHEECLSQWLSNLPYQRRLKCEICNHTYESWVHLTATDALQAIRQAPYVIKRLGMAILTAGFITYVVGRMARNLLAYGPILLSGAATWLLSATVGDGGGMLLDMASNSSLTFSFFAKDQSLLLHLIFGTTLLSIWGIYPEVPMVAALQIAMYTDLGNAWACGVLWTLLIYGMQETVTFFYQKGAQGHWTQHGRMTRLWQRAGWAVANSQQ